MTSMTVLVVVEEVHQETMVTGVHRGIVRTGGIVMKGVPRGIVVMTGEDVLTMETGIEIMAAGGVAEVVMMVAVAGIVTVTKTLILGRDVMHLLEERWMKKDLLEERWIKKDLLK